MIVANCSGASLAFAVAAHHRCTADVLVVSPEWITDDTVRAEFAEQDAVAYLLSRRCAWLRYLARSAESGPVSTGAHVHVITEFEDVTVAEFATTVAAAAKPA